MTNIGSADQPPTSASLDRILESVVEGIHVLSDLGVVVYENSAAMALLGERVGEKIAYLLPPGPQRDRAESPLGNFGECPAQKTLEDGETRRVEAATFYSKGGESVPVDYICAPLRDASGAVNGVVLSFRDVSRRQRVALLQKCEAQVLSDIVSGKTLEKVLDGIVLTLETLMPGALVSIMLVNEEETHLVLGSAPNMPPAFMSAIEEGIAIGPDSGTCGAAAYRREPVIVSDTLSDPLWKDYRDLAESAGVRASGSWPVLDSSGKPLGTFAIHFREPERPTPADEEAVIHLAASAVIAVEWARREGRLRLLSTCLARLNDTVMITEASPLDEPGPRILFVNDAFLRLTGYSREEVLGRSPRFLQGPDTDRQKLHEIRDALERQEAVRVEILNYTKAGAKYWVETDVAPLFDSSGRLAHFVAVQRDTTERRENEQALRESEARHQRAASQLKKITDSSLDVICSLDAEGHFVTVSRACEDVWGYTAKELVGTPYLDYVVEGDREASMAVAGKVLNGEQVFGFENRYRKKDGRTVHLQWTSRWSETEQLVFAVARDISDSKSYSARIAQQASLLDKARDAIIVRDLGDKVVFWNASAERLYGWTAEEVLGRDYESMVYQDLTSPRVDRSVLLSKGEWVGEVDQVAKDGTLLCIEAHCTLVQGEDGRPDSILTINTDVTRRKKLEQQFLRAQRMESVGTLAGGIAHDLNNVLAPILMAVELLALEISDPEQLESLSTIQESAQRGADMVRHVLTFARGVEGERSQVQVGALISEVLKIVRDTFPKNVDLEAHVGEDLWSVPADVTQLHQVLLNLCVNARDAMPTGGHLRLSAENMVIDEHYAAMHLEAQTGLYVKIEVEDTGCGMAKDILDQIFDPFFTTKELGQGTGLGLSTALSIVKSHQGFLRVYSELNRGTCFRVYLPVGNLDVKEEISGERPQLPQGRGETILVIDDEEAIRLISKKTLESFGYQVLLAFDGLEAIALYATERKKVALVITDMMMPAMDGPSTIRVLRRLNPDVRVIAASGIGTSEMLAEANAAGIKHFLAKPFTTQRLLETVRLAIDE